MSLSCAKGKETKLTGHTPFAKKKGGAKTGFFSRERKIHLSPQLIFTSEL